MSQWPRLLTLTGPQQPEKKQKVLFDLVGVNLEVVSQVPAWISTSDRHQKCDKSERQDELFGSTMPTKSIFSDRWDTLIGQIAWFMISDRMLLSVRKDPFGGGYRSDINAHRLPVGVFLGVIGIFSDLTLGQ